jgi:hypothetical protein
MIDGTALRTEGAVVQLFLLLVRIEDVTLLRVSGDARGGRAPSRW